MPTTRHVIELDYDENNFSGANDSIVDKDKLHSSFVAVWQAKSPWSDGYCDFEDTSVAFCLFAIIFALSR